MKRYEGRREGYAVIVRVDNRRLDPRFDLANHSPSGFEWGYGGSGPAQLALAILADHFGNNDQALLYHQRFKWAVIAELPGPCWSLTTPEIHLAIAVIQSHPVAGGAS